MLVTMPVCGTAIVAVSLLLPLAGLQGAPATSPPAEARTQVPRAGELNPFVLAVVKSYPADGTHTYYWPKGEADKGWKGCTKDLRYRGRLLARGDAKQRAYCCGLTFEVFLEAWMRWCKATKRKAVIKDFDLAAVRKLQAQWFGSAADKTCLRTALCDNGLGERIVEREAAQPGDFVQLWRSNGSGHSVVFLGWQRESGQIVGIRYWSTQKRTNGIGTVVERFATKELPGALADQTWICRVGVGPAGAARKQR
jgi:hypothetical protein